jgi:hypothetical protein
MTSSMVAAAANNKRGLSGGNFFTHLISVVRGFIESD